MTRRPTTKRHGIARAGTALILIGALAGCGTASEDRIGGGAALGAGVGAGIGALFGGAGALGGALIGAGVGGVGGAATTPGQVDLGEPIWKR